MSYNQDATAWQQRIGHEYHAYQRHLKAVQHNLIKPITRSQHVDPELNTQYTDCFNHLLTQDQIRDYQNSFKIKQRYAQQRPFNFDSQQRWSQAPSQPQYQNLQYPGVAQSLAVGAIPKAAKQSFVYFQNLQEPRYTIQNVSPTRSIYELCSKQDIKMPEGLMFRGKYAGKSKQNKYENGQYYQEIRSVSALGEQNTKQRPQTGVNRHKIRALKKMGSNLKRMNNIKDIKDNQSETKSSQQLYSVNKLRSKTNFLPTANDELFLTTPSQVRSKPSKALQIRSDERYRFNEGAELKNKPASKLSATVSLKTRDDLDQISRATRVSASGLGQSNNGSFKSVMTLSHFSRKSGKTRTVKGSSKKGLLSKTLQNSQLKTILNDDRSIKTAEILNKFNEFNMFKEANQTIDINSHRKVGTEDLLGEERENGEEQIGAKVDEGVQDENEVNFDQENDFEYELIEVIPVPEVAKSVSTKISGKSYIQQLQSELDGEKLNRQQLQKELEEMKAIAKDISAKFVDGKLH